MDIWAIFNISQDKKDVNDITEERTERHNMHVREKKVKISKVWRLNNIATLLL